MATVMLCYLEVDGRSSRLELGNTSRGSAVDGSDVSRHIRLAWLNGCAVMKDQVITQVHCPFHTKFAEFNFSWIDKALKERNGSIICINFMSSYLIIRTHNSNAYRLVALVM